MMAAASENESKVNVLLNKVEKLESGYNELRTQQTMNEEKLTDLQWRGMRENLIFTGIKEPNLPRGEYEHTEATLKTFLRDEMNIEKDIAFDRVHRLGKFDRLQKYPRPIIAKFERFKDKESVRLAAPRTLNGKNFGVREQFPVEIEEKRKLLYPEAKKLRRNQTNNVRLVKDKLYLNGRDVTTESMQQTLKNRETQWQYRQPQNNRQYQSFQPDKEPVRQQFQRENTSFYAQRNREQHAWSTPRSSQRSEHSRVRDPELPVSNMYNALQDEISDLSGTRRPTGGKKKAVSPLERDVIFKRQREQNEASNETITEENTPMDMQTTDDNNSVTIIQNVHHSAEYYQDVLQADAQTSNNEQTVNSKNENNSVTKANQHEEADSTHTQNSSCSQPHAGTSTIQIPKYVNSAQLYYGPTIRSPETPQNIRQNEHINQTNGTGSSMHDPAVDPQSS